MSDAVGGGEEVVQFGTEDGVAQPIPGDPLACPAFYCVACALVECVGW